MKNFAFLFALAFLAAGSFDIYAQCPGCIITTVSCDSTNITGQVCADTLADGTAGLSYEEQVTFKYPRRVTMDLSQILPIPIPGFPTMVVTNVLRVTLDSVVGLPPGLAWECDSSANGCQYIPALFSQHGCLKICGTLPCTAAGNFTPRFVFTYHLDSQSILDSLFMGQPFPFPLPAEFPSPTEFSLPLKVVSVSPATLDITANKPLVIAFGESITLTASAGFSAYAWSTGDTTGALTLTPQQSTTYSLTATDANGCTQQDSIGITVIPPTGIGNYFSNQIEIFPNPSEGNFTLKALFAKKGTGILISDISGKVLYSNEIKATAADGEKISLATLEPGIYFLQLKSDNISAVKKIIIH